MYLVRRLEAISELDRALQTLIDLVDDGLVSCWHVNRSHCRLREPVKKQKARYALRLRVSLVEVFFLRCDCQINRGEVASVGHVGFLRQRVHRDSICVPAEQVQPSGLFQSAAFHAIQQATSAMIRVNYGLSTFGHPTSLIQLK